VSALSGQLSDELAKLTSSQGRAIDAARRKVTQNKRRRAVRHVLENGQQEWENKRTETAMQYEMEYRQLLCVLDTESHFGPPANSSFRHLTTVCADLQKELADGHARIETERNLITYKWKKRIRSESERLSKAEAEAANRQLRESVILQSGMSGDAKSCRASATRSSSPSPASRMSSMRTIRQKPPRSNGKSGRWFNHQRI
jgi:hypothetical protein